MITFPIVVCRLIQDNVIFVESNLLFPPCFVGLFALFTFSLPDGHRLLLKKEIMEQQILKYRIDRLLGEGGMSRVWLGVDPVTGQRVAIKVLHPHLAEHNKIRALFLQEAESLAKLDHPGIVMLVDYNPEQLVLVQQYIDGMDLEEYITHHRGPIPEEEAKELFCKMLEAFAYVHSNKVIHRDIKPANILMTRGNHIKVVDFGIAKETETGRDTSTGTPMGTIPYMSPEQIKSNPGEKIDHRTDIYSLGVLLHQMLTGKPPYDTQKESLFDIQLKIVQEPLPRMQGIYEYVSKEMQAVVDKATAKDRNRRYQSCEEFLRAVKALKTPSTPPSKPDWREWLRDKRVMAGVGVALLLLFALVVFLNSGVPEQWKKQDAAKRYEQGKSLYDAGNYADARALFETAAGNGNVNAQFCLASIYDSGQGVTKDYAEAIKWYRMAGAQGSVDAQNNLGEIYYLGKDGTVNYAEAAKWYRPAAEQGNMNAQFHLGYMYDTSQGVTRDYVEAIKWYRLAGAQGSVGAQNNLGEIYYYGNSGKVNYGEAAKWYRPAAEQGNMNAQFRLGYMYESSQGVTRDYAEAVKWYRLAANQGGAVAQNNLGRLYDGGYGVTQNYAEALKWFRLAAVQGNPVAQNNLGIMYEYGQGVAANRALAKEWYKKSCNNGCKDGCDNLRSLNEE